MESGEKLVMSGTMPQVLHYILSQLPAIDVCRLGQVCSDWQSVATTNHLWKDICQREAVDLHQLTLPTFHEDAHQGLCYYKWLYKTYALTMKKWATGEGVATYRKTLKNRTGSQDFRGHCLAVSSWYIFAAQTRALSTDDYAIHVFSASTGEYSHQLTGSPGADYVSLRVSVDGMKVAAYVGQGAVVRVWNAQSGECMHILQHNAVIRTMVMHDDVLAVGLEHIPSVSLWSMTSGQLLHQLQVVQVVSHNGLAMDGQHIAVLDNDECVVQLWDINTGTHLFTWTQTDTLDQILLDSGTNSLVGKEHRGIAVTVWDTKTGIRRARINRINNKQMRAMLVKQGKLLIICFCWNPMAFEILPTEIGVLDLDSCAGGLSWIGGGPPEGGGEASIEVLMYDVSNGLLLVRFDYSLHVWDVHRRQYREIDTGVGIHLTTRMNASFAQLQVVSSERECGDRLTYATHNFHT